MLIRRIARPMLATTFIARGVDALRSPKPAADAARPVVGAIRKLPTPVTPNSVPDAETVAQVTAAVQIGGGLLLATGRLPRVASGLLALSVIPGGLGTHSFWSEPDPARQAEQRRAFLADISLLGGLIIAAVDTEGKPSLAWRGRRAARTATATVAAALPLGDSAGESLVDSAMAEKIGHGLQTGAERGRELAEAARERAVELAHVAREHGPDLAQAAGERAATVADIARERGAELGEMVRTQLNERRAR
jgi:uncharacterized membrane protein YphA (DoxX/SURF4 family)